MLNPGLTPRAIVRRAFGAKNFSPVALGVSPGIPDKPAGETPAATGVSLRYPKRLPQPAVAFRPSLRMISMSCFMVVIWKRPRGRPSGRVVISLPVLRAIQ